jgi:L-ascorbate metabolism protein UlaG (beta-lactamase superfamily)
VGLAVQWLGTAGFRVLSRGHHVWLDPHLSRHALGELALGKLEPRLDRIRAEVDIAHAVAVGHSHFDHALDAPAVAQLHGARVYGSGDTLNWCRGAGVPEQNLVEMHGRGEIFAEGPFAVRAVLSAHSPFFAGRVPFPGRIEQVLRAPAHCSSWRVGLTFGLHLQCAGVSVYHLGSANLVEAELAGIQADVLLCCTVGRQAVRDFTRRAIRALRPKIVVPCHWDQFWTPIDGPLRQIPSNDLGGFLREVAACPNAPVVRVLPIRGWVVVEP